MMNGQPTTTFRDFSAVQLPDGSWLPVKHYQNTIPIVATINSDSRRALSDALGFAVTVLGEYAGTTVRLGDGWSVRTCPMTAAGSVLGDGGVWLAGAGPSVDLTFISVS